MGSQNLRRTQKEEEKRKKRRRQKDKKHSEREGRDLLLLEASERLEETRKKACKETEEIKARQKIWKVCQLNSNDSDTMEFKTPRRNDRDMCQTRCT